MDLLKPIHSEEAHDKPFHFSKGGHGVWSHKDPELHGGYFHTYDHFRLQGNHNHYYKNKAHKIHVYLPRDYHATPKPYPVVYLNDGDTAFWPGGAFNKCWKAAHTVDQLCTQHKLRRVILVAICPTDRDYEYTHTFWHPSKPYGGLEEYAFFVKMVKEFIDMNYNTIASASQTTIAGTAHGGLAAFYISNLFPETFGNCICMSPSFWAGLDIVGFGTNIKSSSLIERLKDKLLGSTHPKVWIDWGLKREDGTHNSYTERCVAERAKELIEILTSNFGFKLNHNLFTFEDEVGGHDEDAWEFRFNKAIQTFYPPHTPPHSPSSFK